MLILRIKKSGFLKQAAILTSGTAIAQLIGIFSAPITYRIYQPHDYGTLGLFMTCSSLFSLFSTLQYHNAIITAEKDDDAEYAALLSVYISIIFTAVSFILIFFLKDSIGTWLGNRDLVHWLYWLPISILFTGLNLIFSALAVRSGKFKFLSGNRIISALIVPAISIAIGLQISGPAGLIIGLLVSQILPTILLIRKQKFSIKHSPQNLKTVGRKFRNFPLFSLPAGWLNNFSNQVPVFLLNSIGGTRLIGYYNLSNRILGMPSQLISTAIGELFRQKATKEYHEQGSCRKTFLKVLVLLAVIGFLPFLTVALFGPELFSFVFGKKWNEAGEISQIFSVLFFFKFVVSPLTYVTYITNKQWIGLLIDILLLSTILIIWLAQYYDLSYKTTLIIYSLSYSGLYFLTLWVSYKLTNNPNYVPESKKLFEAENI
jgi:O-antigen/teichoic acid export membrane protein